MFLNHTTPISPKNDIQTLNFQRNTLLLEIVEN